MNPSSLFIHGTHCLSIVLGTGVSQCVKTGFLLNSHTKLVNEDNIKTKIKKDYHFNPIRSTIYGRIGYNWYGIFASYGLDDFFHTDTAQNGVPVMFGISLVGYR